MPYLSILTNARVADVRNSELLAAAARVVAFQLSKPENYVMVSIVARCEARLTLQGIDH